MSVRVQLGSLVQLSTESAKDPAAVGLTRSVGLDHIDSDDLRLRRWSDIGNGADFTRVFRSGDVLFGKRRSYQRKVALADFNGVCSGDILVVRSTDIRLDGLYLAYLLASPLFIGHAISSSAGSLSPRIRPRDLERFEFDLPSLDEQHRVVEVMRAVDREIGASEQIVSQAKIAIRLVPIVGKRVPISQLVELRKEKISPVRLDGDAKLRSHSLPAYDEGNGFVDEIASKVKSDKWLVEEGDILYSKMNPQFPRVWEVGSIPSGMTAVASTEYVVLKPKIAAWRGALVALLHTDVFKAEVLRLTAGSTKSRSRAHIDEISDIEVQWPSNDSDINDVAWLGGELRSIEVNASRCYDAARALRTSLLQELIG
jgi:hypothetical protein